MVIFKVLLIILIALPVIALASYFYSQMLSYIKVKNAIEEMTGLAVIDVDIHISGISIPE